VNDDSELNFAVFGQIVPIVILILVLLSLWDLFVIDEDEDRKCKYHGGQEAGENSEQVQAVLVQEKHHDTSPTAVAPDLPQTKEVSHEGAKVASTAADQQEGEKQVDILERPDHEVKGEGFEQKTAQTPTANSERYMRTK
jgi:hypothetical protein